MVTNTCSYLTWLCVLASGRQHIAFRASSVDAGHPPDERAWRCLWRVELWYDANLYGFLLVTFTVELYAIRCLKHPCVLSDSSTLRFTLHQQWSHNPGTQVTTTISKKQIYRIRKIVAHFCVCVFLTGQSHLVTMIGSYIYHRLDRSLPTLAVLLLKRLCLVCYMVIFMSVSSTLTLRLCPTSWWERQLRRDIWLPEISVCLFLSLLPQLTITTTLPLRTHVRVCVCYCRLHQCPCTPALVRRLFLSETRSSQGFVPWLRLDMTLKRDVNVCWSGLLLLQLRNSRALTSTWSLAFL